MTADFFRMFADGQLKVQQIVYLFESEVNKSFCCNFANIPEALFMTN